MTTHDVETDAGPGLTTLMAGILADGQELIRQQLHLFQVELKNDLKRTAMQEKLAPVANALDKHGLTEKATKDVKIGKTPKEQKAAGKALVKLVKDPGAFLGELLLANDKIVL